MNIGNYFNNAMRYIPFEAKCLKLKRRKKMKISKGLKNSVLVGALMTAQASGATEYVKDILSVEKQNCQVLLKNDQGSVNYQNIGTAIATFSHTWTADIPVEQRMSVQNELNSKSISFSKKAYQKTAGNIYSACLSLVMAKNIFMSTEEADDLLMKTSKNTWLDICVKNSDGFDADNTKIEARSEFIFVQRGVESGRVSLSNTSSRSAGVVTNSGKISGSYSGVQYAISCELEKGEE